MSRATSIDNGARAACVMRPLASRTGGVRAFASRRIPAFVAMVGLALLAALVRPLVSAAVEPPSRGLPPLFVPNAGQLDPSAHYATTGTGPRIQLRRDEVVLSVPRAESGHDELALRFVGAASSVTLDGRRPAAARVNYVLGSDPSRWRTDLPTFAEVVYRGVWPGVDVAVRAERGRIKYEFVVDPGASPAAIRLAYRGADRVALDAAGNLLVTTPHGVLSDARPVSYQLVDGRRHAVESRFAVAPAADGPSAFGFAIGDGYDPRYPLVVDPGLEYSTLLGGSGNDLANGVTVDASGYSYVVGQTESADFAGVTTGTFKGGTRTHGVGDVFVAKLDPNGLPVWITYLGGTDQDVGLGIALEPGCTSACAPYITGFTYSSDFPVTGGALSTKITGGSDAFVTKLTANGASLTYSTFLGGGSDDAGHGIAVDSLGRAYVVGETRPSNFPVVAGPFAASQGKLDAFMAKLNAGGSAIVYSTYIGGTGDDIAYAIALSCPFPSDGTKPCDAYVTGQTASNNFPTRAPSPAQPYDSSFGGRTDAFVVKLNTAATGLASLTYSTYLGGSGDDAGFGIAVRCAPGDPTACDAYVTGQTSSGNFPIWPASRTFGASLAGTTDAFVIRLNATGSALVYSTFLGGSGKETAYGIAVDGLGHAFVTGQTDSSSFPTTTAAQGAYDPAANGGTDVFVTKLKVDGSGLFNSTYLGGAAADVGYAIAYGCTAPADCAAYVGGKTSSAGFPHTAGNFNSSALSDAFVAKLDMRANTSTALTSSPTSSGPGTPITFTATVTSLVGEIPSGTVTFRDGTTVLGTGALDATGAATLTTSSLTLGTHSITAEYGGDADFNGSTSASVSQPVFGGPTSMSMSAPTVTFNANGLVTVTVTSAGGTPSGVVSLTVDGSSTPITQTLANGSTTFTLESPSAGTHTLSASYAAQNGFGASSSSGTLVVNPTGSTTTITAAPTVTFNANAQVTVTVTSSTGTPTGTVSLSVDGAPNTSGSLVNGSATLTVTSPSAGDHTLVATYAAQGNFAGSTSQPVTLHVNPAPPALTVPGPITKTEGEVVTFQVGATDLDSSTLVVSASNLPLGATFDPATRTFTWTPNSAQGGANPYVVYFSVTDGTSTDLKAVVITVNDTIADADGDGIPDRSDLDGDGVISAPGVRNSQGQFEQDNCPETYNPDQADICHNSPQGASATSALSVLGGTNGQLNITITVSFTGDTNGFYVVPPSMFNSICRLIDNATGQPVPFAAVPEGPPVILSPTGSPDGLQNVPPSGTTTLSTTFDLRLFYPNLPQGSYTVLCDYVNFAHNPQPPEPDDPTIWMGLLSAPPLTVFSGTYVFSGFSSPADNEPFNQGRTVPVKFSLTDTSGVTVTTATPRIFVQQLDNQHNPIGDPIPATPNSGTDNIARYNATNNQYIFNMSTKGMAVSRWRLIVLLDDGTTHTIDIRVTR